MPSENERKFLVKNLDFLNDSTGRYAIKQGYLSSVPERTVRIRILDKKSLMTIKGIGDETGISRYEWEKALKMQDALELFALCEPGHIEKDRVLVPAGKHCFEVDIFLGLNAPLIMAEIELVHRTEEFIRPQWLGEEVTGDERYYNSYLAKHPYSTW
jgi:adenylate cyclase